MPFVSAIGLAALVTSPACAPFPPTAAPSLGPCTAVREVSASSSEGAALLSALLDALSANQPPDLQTSAPYGVSEVRSILVADSWSLLQVSFEGPLEPGIFLIEGRAGNYSYEGYGWSGQAPNAQTIRADLARQAPLAPAGLFTCLSIAEWFLP